MRLPIDHRCRGERGFSVLEMLISLAVLAVAMFIASRLLLESQMRMAHSARRALDPVATIALKQIRADVRRSADFVASDAEWTWDTLILTGHPAGTVRYEKEGSDLIRKIGGGGSEEGSGRIVMKGVTIWRWRASRGVRLPLVEIELGYRETPRLGLLTSGGQREAPIPLTRKHRVTVGPRQAIGRSGW